MKTISKLSIRVLLGTLLFAATTLSQRAATSSADDAREFVKAYGENWEQHWSPDIIEAYPGGGSNAANDAVDAKTPVLSTDWQLTNKHYIFDGDHYAVQWIYQSKWKDNGKIQRESTLAFGIVKDHKLISWTEFYDDSVGELQHDGKLPLFGKDEEPFPWPKEAKISRPYRAYDPNSVLWKNYPKALAPAAK